MAHADVPGFCKRASLAEGARLDAVIAENLKTLRFR